MVDKIEVGVKYAPDNISPSPCIQFNNKQGVYVIWETDGNGYFIYKADGTKVSHCSGCLGKSNVHLYENLTTKIIKSMSNIITNALKSKEDKALEAFKLGTTAKLTPEGQSEYIDFMFETDGKGTKADFLAKIVAAYEELNKIK
jgi:hypothetical protein